MDGFLPYARGSLMLDLVVVAMAAVLPLLAWSIAQARAGRWQAHKRTQVATAAVLGLALTAFEIDIRLHGWRHLAEPSPFYPTGVFWSLGIHLACAVAAVALWIVVLSLALRRFPKPVAPSAHSRLHRRLGWAAALSLVATTVTGWIFYALAFVAG